MKRTKPKFRVGQVVMLVPINDGTPQPAVFRSYEKGRAIVDFAGKGFRMALTFVRPLTKRERGERI